MQSTRLVSSSSHHRLGVRQNSNGPNTASYRARSGSHPVNSPIPPSPSPTPPGLGGGLYLHSEAPSPGPRGTGGAGSSLSSLGVDREPLSPNPAPSPAARAGGGERGDRKTSANGPQTPSNAAGDSSARLLPSINTPLNAQAMNGLAQSGAERGPSTPTLQSSRTEPLLHMHITADRLRPISDPVDRILQQLHKLVFVSQLPPTADRDMRKVALHNYKRSLFARPETCLYLKEEMKRVSVVMRHGGY